MARRWIYTKNLSKVNDFQEKSALKSLQYQMLDVCKPFLHSWNQLQPDNPLVDSMESGLLLLGSAFTNISKLRRSNVMRNVASNLSPLLKDPRVFSSRESEYLYKFIDAMVKEVDTDDKIVKIARGGGSSSNQHRSGNFYQRNHDRNQGQNGGGGQSSGFIDRNRRGSNKKVG
jgi:hypothetical protein